MCVKELCGVGQNVWGEGWVMCWRWVLARGSDWCGMNWGRVSRVFRVFRGCGGGAQEHSRVFLSCSQPISCTHLSATTFSPQPSFSCNCHLSVVTTLLPPLPPTITLTPRFDPKKADSLILRTHCQTSGYSLTAQVGVGAAGGMYPVGGR